MKLSKEAHKQAVKDIRVELRKENKSYINTSLKQLKSCPKEHLDVYCSAMDVYLNL